MTPADVIAMARRLGAPHCVERSAKIHSGAVLGDRCLVTVNRSALGNEPAEKLAELGRGLAMPGEFIDALPAALDDANAVHFGFEGSPGQDIIKIYVEHSHRAREAQRAPNPVPTLVHVAFKWALQSNETRAIARYTWVPCATRREIEAKLREVAPPVDAPISHRFALDLLARAAHAVPASELFVMEVAEEGNPRRSWDINVYNAGLRLRHVADLAETAARAFDAPAAAWRPLIAANIDAAFGHLSGGVGRGGGEFATIYFGVEEH